MANAQESQTWPDLAIGLYDKLTGRGAEIAYHFENLQVGIPAGTDPNAASAKWTLNGTLKIRTRDQQQG